MSGIDRAREALEQLWKTRVEEAKAKLDVAAEFVEELSEPGTIHQINPDDHNNAIRVYTEALEEYASTSRIYQDLVLHGTIPNEPRPRAMNAGEGNHL